MSEFGFSKIQKDFFWTCKIKDEARKPIDIIEYLKGHSMNIELKEFIIRDIANGYINDNENGVVGFDKKLNIRPKYQREFVYDDDKRNAVIDTIRKGFPLNVMYWAKTDNGEYELMDGQQRTISFCSYINGDFSLKSSVFFQP